MTNFNAVVAFGLVLSFFYLFHRFSSTGGSGGSSFSFFMSDFSTSFSISVSFSMIFCFVLPNVFSLHFCDVVMFLYQRILWEYWKGGDCFVKGLESQVLVYFFWSWLVNKITMSCIEKLHQSILLTQGPICKIFAKNFWELAILKNIVFFIEKKN